MKKKKMMEEDEEAHLTVYFVFWDQNLQGGETKEEREVCTLDGTIDWHGQPAIRSKSGGWVAGIIILCKAPNHLSFKLFLSLTQIKSDLVSINLVLFFFFRGKLSNVAASKFVRFSQLSYLLFHSSWSRNFCSKFSTLSTSKPRFYF